jgi:hypothetical protein
MEEAGLGEIRAESERTEGSAHGQEDERHEARSHQEAEKKNGSEASASGRVRVDESVRGAAPAPSGSLVKRSFSIRS